MSAPPVAAKLTRSEHNKLREMVERAHAPEEVQEIELLGRAWAALERGIINARTMIRERADLIETASGELRHRDEEGVLAAPPSLVALAAARKRAHVEA